MSDRSRSASLAHGGSQRGSVAAGPRARDCGRLTRGVSVQGRDDGDDQLPHGALLSECDFLAPTAGRIEYVTRVDRWRSSTNRGSDRGGLSVALLGADGVQYYGSHLAEVRVGIAPGDWAKAGQPLGTVGETGSAKGTGDHLHFGSAGPPRPTRGGSGAEPSHRSSTWTAGVPDATAIQRTTSRWRGEHTGTTLAAAPTADFGVRRARPPNGQGCWCEARMAALRLPRLAKRAGKVSVPAPTMLNGPTTHRLGFVCRCFPCVLAPCWRRWRCVR